MPGPAEDSLSRRERQILQLVAEGKSSAEIAAILFLSPKTVDTYRSRLMQKLGLREPRKRASSASAPDAFSASYQSARYSPNTVGPQISPTIL